MNAHYKEGFSKGLRVLAAPFETQTFSSRRARASTARAWIEVGKVLDQAIYEESLKHVQAKKRRYIRKYK